MKRISTDSVVCYHFFFEYSKEIHTDIWQASFKNSLEKYSRNVPYLFLHGSVVLMHATPRNAAVNGCVVFGVHLPCFKGKIYSKPVKGVIGE